MNRVKLTAILLLAVAAILPQEVGAQTAAVEQQRDLAASLHFQNGIMATRPGDRRLYVILGSGFLRPLSSGKPEDFIQKWLKNHSSFVVIPVSRRLSTDTINHEQMEIVYIWIEEGRFSLNADLVRSGIFMSGVMYDMVDNQKGLDELLRRDPKLADVRAQIETERAEAPQDRTDRLVPESEYKARVFRFDEAERYARSRKLGIWSNAMKDEREAEGVR